MIHQEGKFSVLCRKRYKSFNFEVHVGVDGLHRKLYNITGTTGNFKNNLVWTILLDGFTIILK